MTGTGLLVGADGLARCGWGAASPDYIDYHDGEWGRPVHGESALFERFTLEAFQSGLSWLTILRKREGFRRAFAQFEADVVAAYGEAEVDRLMADSAIVRNRAKVSAAISNARAVVALRDRVEGGLDALVWSFAPDPDTRSAPGSVQDLTATSPESMALAKALKRHGVIFVGPTTAHAAMQACGLVDDHLVGCHARGRARR